jgi:hypothetical protein
VASWACAVTASHRASFCCWARSAVAREWARASFVNAFGGGGRFPCVAFVTIVRRSAAFCHGAHASFPSAALPLPSQCLEQVRALRSFIQRPPGGPARAGLPTVALPLSPHVLISRISDSSHLVTSSPSPLPSSFLHSSRLLRCH